MLGICNWVGAFAAAALLPAGLFGQARPLPRPAPPRGQLAITEVSLVDVETGRITGDVSVVIADGRIVRIDSAGRVPLRGMPVVHGRGLYLIPGLWDMHVHLAAVPLRPSRGRLADYAENPEWHFPLLLAHGVTGVRDMAGNFRSLRTWRGEVAEGLRAGPRIVHTGWKLHGPEPVVPRAPRQASTVAEIRRSVDMLDSAGADFVKVESMLPEELEAAMAAAREHRLPVAGHVGPWMSARAVSELGVRSIEHLHQVIVAGSTEEEALLAEAAHEFSWWGDYLVRWGWWSHAERRGARVARAVATWDSARAMEVFAVFARNGTWQTPTLTGLRDIQRIQPEIPAERVAWLPPRFLHDDTAHYRGRRQDAALYARQYALQRRVIRMMAETGVPLLAGSDAPGTRRVPGLALVEELETLVDAGLTPLEALRTATLGPAQFLGATDSLGTVAPGKVADLVLLEGNPLADIHALRRVRGVVAAGRFYSRADLDRRLEDVQQLLRRLRTEAAPLAAASASAAPGSTR